MTKIISRSIPPSKNIVIVGALDTKGIEVDYIANLIASRGHLPIIVDCGIKGIPAIQPTISRQEVAIADGTTLDEVIRKNNKNAAIETMARGTAKTITQLYTQHKLEGIIALGGIQGTVIGTTAMQALPVGIPKLMLSAIANGQATFGPFVGTKDIAIMHSVADIYGLNVLTRQILTEAAGAIIGMVEMSDDIHYHNRPTIGLTMAGVTTPCAMQVHRLLEARGYEVIVFHCNGIGAKAMEEMVEEGKIHAVLDLSPHDIGGYLRNGLMKADPNRMKSSIHKGIPIVIVPGATDFTLYGSLETIPSEILKRGYISHNPIHTHVRASKEEMVATGEFVAERLNNVKSSVVIAIPNKGFSEFNAKNAPLFDPLSDKGFVEGLRMKLSNDVISQIEIIELDMHINDLSFAEFIAEKLSAMVDQSQEGRRTPFL